MVTLVSCMMTVRPKGVGHAHCNYCVARRQMTGAMGMPIVAAADALMGDAR